MCGMFEKVAVASAALRGPHSPSQRVDQLIQVVVEHLQQNARGDPLFTFPFPGKRNRARLDEQ